MCVSLDCLTHLSRSEILCPEDNSTFHCSVHEDTVMDWQIASTCGTLDYRTSFSSSSSVGLPRIVTLCSATLNFTVTSLTSSSIRVTLSIHRPVLLNGSRIKCNYQSTTSTLFLSKPLENLIVLTKRKVLLLSFD